MLEDQDNSKLGIMPINIYTPQRHSPGRSVNQQDQDFENDSVEELDQVETDFRNIALTEPEGANDTNAHVHK